MVTRRRLFTVAGTTRTETKESRSQGWRAHHRFAFIVDGLCRHRRPASRPDARLLEFLRVIGRIFSFENLTVGFDEPQGVVDVDVRLRPLQQAFGFETFDVGKVAQCREPKNLQEFLRRDIGEGRAGFWRAQGPVDEIQPLKARDDVAADLPAARREISARVAGCR